MISICPLYQQYKVRPQKHITFSQKRPIISEHWSFQMYLKSSSAKTNLNIDMRLMCILTQENEKLKTVGSSQSLSLFRVRHWCLEVSDMDGLLVFPFNVHGLLEPIRTFDWALPIHLVGGFDWCSLMMGVVCLWYSPSLVQGSKWALIVSYYLEFALVQGAEDLQNFVQISDWSLNNIFFFSLC